MIKFIVGFLLFYQPVRGIQNVLRQNFLSTINKHKARVHTFAEEFFSFDTEKVRL